MSFNEELHNPTSNCLNDEDISQISGVNLESLDDLVNPEEKFEIEESNTPTAMSKLLVIGGGVGASVLILQVLLLQKSLMHNSNPVKQRIQSYHKRLAMRK